jgi:hypothetical protein
LGVEREACESDRDPTSQNRDLSAAFRAGYAQPSDVGDSDWE